MGCSVRGLAEHLGVSFTGNGDLWLSGVASLDRAGPEDLAFVARPAFADRLDQSRAGAVLVRAELAHRANGAVLVCDDPYLAYARAAQFLHPDRPGDGRRGQYTAIETSAEIAPDVDLGDHVSVGAGAVIDAGVVIGAGCSVGAGARIGPDCRIGPRVVIGERCVLGARVRLQPGVVIGSDGFGYAPDSPGWARIPQVGRVVIGDDVEIGANSTIDRGALDDTVIGEGSIIDNLVHIAHNVHIGSFTAIAACAGIAGSTRVGERCTIGGGAGVIGHLELADDVHITTRTLVTRSIRTAGVYSSGTPFQEHAPWRRNAARFRQLDELVRRVAALEKGRSGTDPDGGGSQ